MLFLINPFIFVDAGGGGDDDMAWTLTATVDLSTLSDWKSDHDVSAAQDVMVIFADVTFAGGASKGVGLRVSTDNGTTFRNGTSDYQGIEAFHSNTVAGRVATTVNTGLLSSASAQRGRFDLMAIRIAAPTLIESFGFNSATNAGKTRHLTNFNGPITNFRFHVGDGTTHFAAGTLYVLTR